VSGQANVQEADTRFYEGVAIGNAPMIANACKQRLEAGDSISFELV
jgi:hypothetical protein